MTQGELKIMVREVRSLLEDFREEIKSAMKHDRKELIAAR